VSEVLQERPASIAAMHPEPAAVMACRGILHVSTREDAGHVRLRAIV
jgi:hypothetical protein